ncbi:DegT/DnrJ/EryC1/StrS family aminotransferase [Shewanella sp. TC10]|uniref:DegT/DnrJ/EryC1/StrS family aminotransferase n=1 Tax=Shewanella sp. TC10 TaxID=1419739 RepID=UPI00129D69D8|nr:DegT/DnrJ/EryC1/StrS family aminotransferase [Shewanella sp. TC10]
MEYNSSLTMDFIVKHLDSEKGLALTKLCHGFWELRVRLQQESDSEDHLITNEDFSNVIKNWPIDLFNELLDILANEYKNNQLMSLCSAFGWRNGLEIEGTPIEGLDSVNQLIKSSHHKEAKIYDGLFWKNSISNGDFAKFISVIQQRPIVVIGPDYLHGFSSFAGLTNSKFVEVDSKKAAWERNEIIDKVSAYVEELGSGTICLFQAGGTPSSWMVSKLIERHTDSFFFVLGQALNICNVAYLENKNWFLVDRKAICDCIELINPSWNISHNHFSIDSPFFGINSDTRWDVFKKGVIPPKFIEVNESQEPEKLSFIENKPIDFKVLESYLSTSKLHNHWANFGPVTEVLENTIAANLALASDKKVLMTKSGTDAIHLAVSLAEARANKSLRWIVSSFGFMSTNIGCLSNASLIDCDIEGQFSLDALKAIPLDAWDGVVVTNIFGLATKLKAIEKYCQLHGKKIILDNATGYILQNRAVLPNCPEIISFHQTKPWGLGEGGCLILDEEEYSIARKLINFGVGADKTYQRFAYNGKISDFNSALILYRLSTVAQWSHLYRMQTRRIIKLAKQVGIKPISTIPNNTIMAYVPLISPSVVKNEMLDNNDVIFRKYYKPLDDEQVNASNIYEKIFCVPCHGKVADISDEKLLLLFSNLIK